MIGIRHTLTDATQTSTHLGAVDIQAATGKKNKNGHDIHVAVATREPQGGCTVSALRLHAHTRLEPVRQRQVTRKLASSNTAGTGCTGAHVPCVCLDWRQRPAGPPQRTRGRPHTQPKAQSHPRSAPTHTTELVAITALQQMLFIIVRVPARTWVALSNVGAPSGPAAANTERTASKSPALPTASPG